MLKIKRYSAWVDAFRKYKIILDGKEIGKIKNGESLEFPIEQGEHSLVLKIDYARSNKVSFSSNNENVEFVCGSNLKGWKILLTPIYSIFLFNQYVRLEQKR